MKRILVHLHIYYHDQTDFFIEKLSNITDCEWDLFVTMTGTNKDTENKITAFKKDTHIIRTENIGYDIWPFIKVIKSVNLDRYDYVMKLHTKSESVLKIHKITLCGYEWRNALVNSLLGSRRKFRKILKIFSQRPDIGIICCRMLWMKTSLWHNEDSFLLDRELRRIGFKISDRHFCVGTMFIARSRIFRYLQKDNITENIFPHIQVSHSGGSMAHVYERILSMAANAYGYRAATISQSTAAAAYLVMNKAVSIAFKHIFSINREEKTGEKFIYIFGMKIRAGLCRGILTRMEIFFKGHLFNGFWKGHDIRSRKKGEVIRKAVDRYLDCYVPYMKAVQPDPQPSSTDNAQPERIFTIWLQGEENAPAIVKACFRSMKHLCSQRITILDSRSLEDWISLPGYIMDKWNKGKIKPAHFADICRVELLYEYGGIWLDATGFVTSPVPQWILDEDFFIYLGGETVYGYYAFVQNCFFRAKKGNHILKTWREGIHTYWEQENRAIEYFIHQMILRKAVECNSLAGQKFEKMPHLIQDPTHRLWWKYRDKPFDPDIFKKETSGAFFQKIEYKSASALSPVKGSFADIMTDMYL